MTAVDLRDMKCIFLFLIVQRILLICEYSRIYSTVIAKDLQCFVEKNIRTMYIFNLLSLVKSLAHSK